MGDFWGDLVRRVRPLAVPDLAGEAPAPEPVLSWRCTLRVLVRLLAGLLPLPVLALPPYMAATDASVCTLYSIDRMRVRAFLDLDGLALPASLDGDSDLMPVMAGWGAPTQQGLPNRGQQRTRCLLLVTRRGASGGLRIFRCAASAAPARNPPAGTSGGGGWFGRVLRSCIRPSVSFEPAVLVVDRAPPSRC